MAYATRTGCTADVARWIGEELHLRGATVDVRAAGDDISCMGYDAVVIGSGVRAGSWHKAARQWVIRNAEMLRSVPVAFFVVGLKMARSDENAPEVRGYVDPLIGQSGVVPVDVGLFPGWSRMERFSLPERLVLKAMKVSDADFRDEAGVRAWASRLCDLLGSR